MDNGRVSLGQKLAYSAYFFGRAIPGRVGNLGSLLFFTQVVGLDPLKLGVVAILPTFWDAVTDPIMGAISDRTRTRWGRRRPYIMVGGLMCVLGTALHWTVPAWYVPWATAHGFPVNWIYVFLFIQELFNRTFATVVNVPYAALGAEMSDIPHERNKVVATRGLVTNIGMIIGMIIGMNVLEVFDITAYPYLVVSLLSMTILGTIATSVGCKERRLTNIKKQKPTLRSMAKDMAKVFTFKPFVMFVIMFLIAQMAFTVTKGLLVFIGRFWLLDNTIVFKFEILLFVVMTFSLMIWPKILRAVGNKNAQLFTLSSMAVIFGFTYFFFQPYNGDPTFTGKPLESMGRRVAYKILLFKCGYTGIDIRDISKLKEDAKANKLVGERYFEDMDLETETNDNFIDRLNEFIKTPNLFETIKDTPYFSGESFKDYNGFVSEQSLDESVLTVFLAGRRLEPEISDVSLEVLNNSLLAPLFYELCKESADMAKLPKGLLLMEKQAIRERLKAQLSEFASNEEVSFDLGNVDFDSAQLRALGEIIHEEEFGNWHVSILKFFGQSDETIENKYLKKLKKNVHKELRRRFKLKKGEHNIPLNFTPEEIEKVAFFNRALLEHVYGEEIVTCRDLDVQKAKDKLKLMLIRTAHVRQEDFEVLDTNNQHDIMTTNRLLLAHMFKDNVQDSVPTLRIGWVYVFAILVGLVAGGLSLMPGTMIPDVADADELQTGFRRMGLLFGVESFAMKVEHSIVPLLKGLLLAAIGIRSKVDLTTTPEQLAEICAKLRFWYAVPAVTGCLLAFFLLIMYPLNNARLREIRANLQIQRDEQEKENAASE
ncbi:MFS transporter [Candidatus Hydrogenedentota bacterium]